MQPQDTIGFATPEFVHELHLLISKLIPISAGSCLLGKRDSEVYGITSIGSPQAPLSGHPSAVSGSEVQTCAPIYPRRDSSITYFLSEKLPFQIHITFLGCKSGGVFWPKRIDRRTVSSMCTIEHGGPLLGPLSYSLPTLL